MVQVRTSYGMFIPRYQDPIIGNVQERIAKWSGVPVSHQEDMQVLRYSIGESYKEHMDANGRMCTVLLYLTGMPSLVSLAIALQVVDGRFTRDSTCGVPHPEDMPNK
jgi:hypothetical protein